MLRNLKKAYGLWRRENARRYLYEAAPAHLDTAHQMCCYSFDGIGIGINVDGRCDGVALDALLKLVDVSGRNVLDVGANIGNHTVAFASNAARVFAFEPHPRTVQLLRLNTAGLQNVTVFNLGASDQAATVHAVSPHHNFGATAITDRKAGPGESSWTFEVVSLDSIPDLRNIALLKLDVEGHEARALAGARALLQREQPVVVVEQNANAIDGGTSESVELLKGLGYGHFCSLDTVLPWRTPQFLPGPLRKLMRMAESVLLGPADWSARITVVDRLEKRDYPMLIASTRPLLSGPQAI